MFSPMFHAQNRNSLKFVPPSYTPLPLYHKEVAMSYSGKYISAIYSETASGLRYMMRSDNFGNLFSISSGYTGNDFRHIGMSGNGQYQVVGGLNTKLYLSSNYGVTFSEITSSPSLQWEDIAINNDGSIMAAREDGGLWMSSNYGSTWNKTFDFSGYSVVLSSSGQYIYTDGEGSSGGTYYDTLFRSSNYGVDFTKTDKVFVEDVNLDGDYVFGKPHTYIPVLLKSSDYGLNFTSTSLSFYIDSIRCSGQGDFLVSTIENETYRKYSTDYGSTWNNTPSVPNADFTHIEIAKDSPHDQVLYWGIHGAGAPMYRTTDNGTAFYEIGLP